MPYAAPAQHLQTFNNRAQYNLEAGLAHAVDLVYPQNPMDRLVGPAELDTAARLSGLATADNLTKYLNHLRQTAGSIYHGNGYNSVRHLATIATAANTSICFGLEQSADIRAEDDDGILGLAGTSMNGIFGGALTLARDRLGITNIDKDSEQAREGVQALARLIGARYPIHSVLTMMNVIANCATPEKRIEMAPRNFIPIGRIILCAATIGYKVTVDFIPQQPTA